MKKSELFFASIALLAWILKVFDIPGSAFIIVISLSCLTMLYFYLGFALLNDIPLRKIAKKDSYKDISTMRIVGAIVAGVALSQTVVGILFSLLKWQGGAVILATGLIALTLVAVVAMIKYFQSKPRFYLHLLTRAALFGCIGLSLFL